MAPIIITGVQTGIPPGHPTAADYPTRLEWTVFANDPYNVTLYVKALEKIMSLSQAESVPLSFFQIAGMAPSFVPRAQREASTDFPRRHGMKKLKPATLDTCIAITEVGSLFAAPDGSTHIPNMASPLRCAI